jgi:hypothetical protein
MTTVIRTRSTHAYALVAIDRAESTVVDGKVVPGDILDTSLVGYAASTGPRVTARAIRLSGRGRVVRILPIVDGAVTVPD